MIVSGTKISFFAIIILNELKNYCVLTFCSEMMSTRICKNDLKLNDKF